MPHDITARVLRNLDLGHGNWLVSIEAEAMARQTRAGQFFMVGVPGSDLLLRRPFSVCGVSGTFEDEDPRSLQILYKVVGRGTALLASMRSGAVLELLGPLGTPFGPPRPGALPLFVAGGIGSAPFPALATTLESGPRPPWMVYGARSAGDLPLLDWFRQRCGRVEVTTEDASLGASGRVTGPLATLLQGAEPGSLHLYACGPNPMLQAVGRLAQDHGMECELSLEAPMACGFGVCLGCVVPCRDPSGQTRYERVCVEGPVMAAARLAW
jgi:dihydroorotate dehydrogenase electron transfer subunit